MGRLARLAILLSFRLMALSSDDFAAPYEDMRLKKQ